MKKIKSFMSFAAIVAFSLAVSFGSALLIVVVMNCAEVFPSLSIFGSLMLITLLGGFDR